jgi:4-amino-4-deoxy-L-arabinose transferase-like glycosyltransferase
VFYEDQVTNSPRPKRPWLATAAVFLAAFLALSFNLWRTGIASGWIDPILHYGAMDEALYTSEAIYMASHGAWMTPTLLGRWVFEKPPLLMWLSAVSMKLLGIGPFAARLPAVLAGALLVALCFAIARAVRSTAAGIAAALLCLCSPLLFAMSRRNMTDVLLAAVMVTVVAVLIRDPALARAGSRVVFVVAIAAGVLDKSVAGLLPALAALPFAVVMRRSPWRIILLSACAIALASPWFLYNLAVHREWFLADLGFQIVTTGVRAGHQTSSENQVLFYLLRLAYGAPAALLLLVTGVPALLRSLRRLHAGPLLLVCYLAVVFAALMAFRFRSEQYLTWLIPAVILAAVVSTPLLAGRRATWLTLALGAILVVEAAVPGRPWSLSWRPGSTIPAAPALSRYCEERRGNELYILGVVDQFYAATLPLGTVRYGWVDPADSVADTHPHLEYLGISQSATAPPDVPRYAERLRAWGMNSTAPIRTGILARNADELAALVRAHPEADFLVSPEIARRLGEDRHIVRAATPTFVLLESAEGRPAGPAPRTCRM